MAERLPFDTTDRSLATAAWSRLAEPGDPAAHLLVGAVGAGPALDWLVLAAQSWIAPPGVPDHPEWRRAVDRWAPRVQGLDPRRELDTIRRRDGYLLLPGAPQWPVALDDLGREAPLCLWVIGPAAPSGLCASAVALVGSRASTRYGEQVAAELATGLADAGVTVVSGGAFGIDAAAHRAAVAVEGPVLAVMAGGLDRYYPVANTTMLERVAQRGAVVAEAPPGTAPMRSRFLQRNRLIAALSGATVVVEAAWRSGALNTAAHAGELLRPVGAVPGPVTSMASAGCHRLLREGAAVLVTDAAEVLELIQPVGSGGAEDPPVPAGLLDDLEPAQARVLDALPVRGSTSLEALARSSGLSPGEVRSALGFLELGARVSRNGTTWRRSPTSGPKGGS